MSINPNAEKAWNAAVKRFDPVSILHALAESKKEWAGRELKYIPYAASWLRATDFDDEFEACVDDPEPPLFREQAMRDKAEDIHMGLRIDRERWEAGKRAHKHGERCQWNGYCPYPDDMEPPYVPDVAEILEAMKHEFK